MANIEKKSAKLNRRKFFKGSTLVMVGGALAYGIGSARILRSEDLLLRPPGALEENAFLASCIKCGQCLQVCPPQVVKLGKIDQGFGIGTPYIVPLEGACILCRGLPCVLACPTGALDHEISEGKEAAMGLAVISRPDTCLSIKGINGLVFQLENLAEVKDSIDLGKLSDLLTGLVEKLTPAEKEQWKLKFQLLELSPRVVSQILTKINPVSMKWIIEFMKGAQQTQHACRICLEECPINEESPISFKEKIDPDSGKKIVHPIVQKTCVGCGVCEMKCPTPEPSITIVPRLKWKEVSV
ncbi:MAG: 4Fe-4S dicluster domain-containing protein [SAR324 cluster bacterium]|nr:4Fe-4S dicluster domain-containing protein [SAR324 cluster bacterium]